MTQKQETYQLKPLTKVKLINDTISNSNTDSNFLKCRGVGCNFKSQCLRFTKSSMPNNQKYFFEGNQYTNADKKELGDCSFFIKNKN